MFNISWNYGVLIFLILMFYITVQQALLFIFVCYKERCVTFIPQVLPVYLDVIKSAESTHKEYLFQTLGELIKIVKNHIRNFLDDIFKLIKDHWGASKSSDAVQGTLIELIEQIVTALGAEFKLHVPQLIPHILEVLQHDRSRKRVVTAKLLSALRTFESNLDDYLHIILPQVIALFHDPTVDIKVREEALNTIDALSYSLDITEYSSCIIRYIMEILEREPDLREPAMNALVGLVGQMGKSYTSWCVKVQPILSRNNIRHSVYEALVQRILKGDSLVDLVNGGIGHHINGQIEEGIGVGPSASGGQFVFRRKRKQLKQKAVTDAITTAITSRTRDVVQDPKLLILALPSDQATKEDCREWFKNLSIKILRESPSLALRSCFPLAQSHPQITRDLFNAAFLAAWSDLAGEQQEQLIKAIHTALTLPDVSPEITQIFLNLAEFMEHCERGPLQLNCQILAERATKCRAFAKALHYKEEEFHTCPSSKLEDVLESLISINTKLQQSEAAFGVLEYAKRSSGGNFKIRERWYEKLHEWEDALQGYRARTEKNPNDTDALVGEMRCLENLGEWKRLHDVAEDSWGTINIEEKERMAKTVASASWSLGDWTSMEKFVKQIPEDSADSSFFQAVLEIRNNNFEQAQILIDRGRGRIEGELTAMVGESYNRAYVALVQVMMLSELEEVIQFKLIPERRELIRDKWWRRLQGCQRTVEDWQKILLVHSLVLPPHEDVRTWLKFASLCQESRRLAASHRILCRLLGLEESEYRDKDPSKLFPIEKKDKKKDEQEDGQKDVQKDGPKVRPLPMDHPPVTFAYIKHEWKCGLKEQAFTHLQEFVDSYSRMDGGSSLAVSTSNVANGLLIGQPFMNNSMIMSMSGNFVGGIQEITGTNGGTRSETKKEMDTVLSRCFLKLGQWTEGMKGINDESIPAILQYYEQAKEKDKSWYKAWHAWAYMNYEAVLFYKQQAAQAEAMIAQGLAGQPPMLYRSCSVSSTSSQPSQARPMLQKSQWIREYTVPAVKGFFHSITLSQGNSLQDTLRLLTLWFEDGNYPDVYESLNEGINTVPVETWLQVIPQLIARIDTPRHLVGRLIHKLLVEIGKHHPQSLIYPLTVAAKATVAGRQAAARKILSSMKENQNSTKLVNDAELVSRELIRVAILWHEQWHEGLEGSIVL